MQENNQSTVLEQNEQIEDMTRKKNARCCMGFTLKSGRSTQGDALKLERHNWHNWHNSSWNRRIYSKSQQIWRPLSHGFFPLDFRLNQSIIAIIIHSCHSYQVYGIFNGHLISRPWHDRHHGTTAGVPHSHVPWFLKIMPLMASKKMNPMNSLNPLTKTTFFKQKHANGDSNHAQWTIWTYIVHSLGIVWALFAFDFQYVELANLRWAEQTDQSSSRIFLNQMWRFWM